MNPVTLSDNERRLEDNAPTATIESRLEDLIERHGDPSADASMRIDLAIDIAGLMLDLDRKQEAWQYARPVVDASIEMERFEDAALACQFVYLAGQEDALSALGHAAWLAVSYPVDPGLTLNVLNHIVDETPDNADGAAVAAASAQYVVDLRATPDRFEELNLFTGAMLANVARRHSNIQSQAEFDTWVERLELKDPDQFLVRLRNVIDVIVQDDWWFDRELLKSRFADEPNNR